ncbi:MAG: zinc ribbon domain-containing protein [Nitrososphaeria archaeon]
MTKHCPFCGAPNPDDAVYCIKCGRRFPAEASQQATGQGSQPGVMFCQDCGSPVPYGMTYCPVCGSFRLGPSPPSRIPRPEGVLLLGIIQIIGSAILMAIGAAALAGAVALPPGLVSGALPILAIFASWFIIIGAITLLAAIAFISGREWGRIFMMIAAVIELFNFPIGTIIGIIVLWYLTRPRVKAYFRQPK